MNSSTDSGWKYQWKFKNELITIRNYQWMKIEVETDTYDFSWLGEMNIHNYHEWKLGLIHADTHLWICWQMLFAQKLAHSTSRFIFLLWIPTIITESQEVLATLIFIGTSPVFLDLWLFPSFFVCSKPVFVVSIPHVVSSVLFFIASLQCWLVFLSVFWWWFPSEPSQFLSSPWVWPIISRCYHDFPGQGPTPWAAPWGCNGAGGREVMGWPQVLMVLSSGCPMPCADSIWVCLKIVYPYTQWFCWSLSLLNGYFIGGIPRFQTYPYGAFWTDLMEVNHAEWNLILQYQHDFSMFSLKRALVGEHQCPFPALGQAVSSSERRVLRKQLEMGVPGEAGDMGIYPLVIQHNYWVSQHC